VGKPTIRFDLSEVSLQSNEDLLKRNDYNFQKVMDEMVGTASDYGSEFRKPDVLRPVLGRHPAFDYIEDLFRRGMPYHFSEDLSEKDRQEELRAQLARGNHKSASADPEKVSALLAKDVKHGFSMPVRVEALDDLKGALVQPCGLATQFGLTPDGSRKLKKRLTHDLTYSMTGPRRSVNSRVDMEKYPEMVYGWCLSRTIHFIVALRTEHPNEKILIAKFDYSDAYRRVSHAASSVVQTIIAWAGIAYIALRLAFGGSPNPACFCAFSEMLTDLSNDLSCSSYTPDDFTSPTTLSDHILEKPAYADDVPFGGGIATAVEIPLSETRRKDCFIDDIIAVFLATPHNRERECHTVPVAVHAMSRPHLGDDKEPVPRRPLLAPDKLEAEGRPSERQVVLGWMVDTRTLTVSLPRDKFLAWQSDLASSVKERATTLQSLESLIGRLNHASFLIPLGRHFLNGLREKIPSSRRKGARTWASKKVRFSADDVEDLRLWQKFLAKTADGISMNLLTIRRPTHIAWSDSCPFGIGGYTLKGRAWRIKLDSRWNFRGDDAVNNLLEFLGMTVSILLMIEEAKTERYSVLLALGDNTSAIGWIFRSGRLSKQSAYYYPAKKMARKIAAASIDANVRIVAQHLRGSFNDVADLLSFEGNDRGKSNPLTLDRPDDQTLTRRLHHHYHQIIPEDLTTCPNIPESSSPAGSSASSVITDQTGRSTLLHDVRNLWWRRLCALPSATWLRRFGQTTGRVPCTSATGVPFPANSCHLRSRTYSEPWNKWTRRQSAKKH